MKSSLPVAALAGLLLLLAACGPAKPVTYANPELALTLTYPGDWRPVDRAGVEAGVAVLKKTDTQLSTDGVSAALDRAVLAVAKETKGDAKDSPNLIVLSVPVSATECAAVRDHRFFDVDTAAVKSQVPNARQIISRHVPLAGVSGHSFEFESMGRKVLQRRYWYCAKGNFVLMQGTSSTPAGEAEVKQLLETVVVAAH